MRRAARYLLVLGALIASLASVAQLDDSAPRPVALAPVAIAASSTLLTQADTSGNEYFLKRHEVVPVGSSAIRLPILMYHYIRKPPSVRSDLLGYRLSVAPEVFQAQMDWLYANGYHAVNFNQVRAYFAGTKALPTRPFVITR